MSYPSHNNNYRQQPPLSPAKFFLVVSLFVIAVSILAVYSNITSFEYGLKKDDMHTHAVVHLIKSNDWLNDYEEQKLGEKILQSQIDNVNITLQNNNYGSDAIAQKQANDYMDKYRSEINALHAGKSVEGSYANLKDKEQTEEREYEKILNDISETSKIIMTYELVAILLIVGAGLAATSEVTKNKMVAYPGFAVGSAGVAILLLFLITGATV